MEIRLNKIFTDVYILFAFHPDLIIIIIIIIIIRYVISKLNWCWEGIITKIKFVSIYFISACVGYKNRVPSKGPAKSIKIH